MIIIIITMQEQKSNSSSPHMDASCRTSGQCVQSDTTNGATVTSGQRMLTDTTSGVSGATDSSTRLASAY